MTAGNFKAKKRLDYKKPDFTATDIELNFVLGNDYTVVRSTAHYVRLTADSKAPLRLDGEELELKDVLLNGQPCKYTVSENELIVHDVQDDFELTTECVINPAANTSLMGLYKSAGCFCTQCEPEGFRRITYFLDRPDVLAKYRVRIVAPEYGCGVLLSNGNLVDVGVEDGRNFAVWEDPFPKPSYLFAMVAGTFDIIEDKFVTKSGREVQLGLYVDRGAYSRGKWAMECIKQSMAWDEQRFGLEYDLDVFNVVAVDFFNFGAMENKGLNIFNSSCVLVDRDTATDTNFYTVQGVIGHEYFHNWTGDRVTLRDWFQLSLKESLTVFRDQEFSSDVNSRVLTRLDAVNVIRSRQFAEDAGPMAHPVRPEQVMEMNNFYTVTIYDKGAEIIRMIHTILGEASFQRGVAEYIKHHDGSAATIEDFILSMETASLRDLSQFRRWYSQAGTPELFAKWSYANVDGVTSENIDSEPHATDSNKASDAALAAHAALQKAHAEAAAQKTSKSESDELEDAKSQEKDSAGKVAQTKSNVKLILTMHQSTPPTPGQKTKEPFVIPVRTSFLTAEGESIVPPELPEDGVLLLTKEEQSFEFTNLPKGTIPVVLRDFSAPVKLNATYSVSDLINILEHCDDSFIRVDSFMTLINNYIHENIDKAQTGDMKAPEDIIRAIAYVIHDEKLDLQLKAKLISVPDITTLMETFKKIDIDGLSAAREGLSITIAKTLINDFKSLENKTRSRGKYKYEPEAAARRAVHAVAQHMLCVGYLAVDDGMSADDLISNAYEDSNNMTDRLAALRTAVELDLPCSAKLLELFEDSYGSDPLTFDKFFSVQAAVSSENTVKVVRKLLDHPRFDITNPNRVRALVGTMGYSNPVALHRRDGMGYSLMYDVVSKVNSINPSVAARILDGMINYRRFDTARIVKAEEYLNKIKNIPEVSRSVFEKVEAALKQDDETIS